MAVNHPQPLRQPVHPVRQALSLSRWPNNINSPHVEPSFSSFLAQCSPFQSGRSWKNGSTPHRTDGRSDALWSAQDHRDDRTPLRRPENGTTKEHPHGKEGKMEENARQIIEIQRLNSLICSCGHSAMASWPLSRRATALTRLGFDVANACGASVEMAAIDGLPEPFVLRRNFNAIVTWNRRAIFASPLDDMLNR